MKLRQPQRTASEHVGPLLSGVWGSPHNVGGVIVAEDLVTEVAGELLRSWVPCSKTLQSGMLTTVTQCLRWPAKPLQAVGRGLQLHLVWETVRQAAWIVPHWVHSGQPVAGCARCRDHQGTCQGPAEDSLQHCDELGTGQGPRTPSSLSSKAVVVRGPLERCGRRCCLQHCRALFCTARGVDPGTSEQRQDVQVCC